METACGWLRTLFFCCLLSLRLASAGDVLVEIDNPGPSESHATADAEIRLSGTLTGVDQVARLEWFTGHGAHALLAPAGRWTADGIPLLPGGNWITIVATDPEGRNTSKSLFVFRHPPEPPAAPRQFGTATIDGREITYEIIDGLALVGDEILGSVEDLSPQPAKDGARRYSNVVSPSRLWTNRTMVYSFRSDLPESTRKRFLEGVAYWQSRTPVRFVERTNEANYLGIWPAPAGSEVSSSYVGMPQGWSNMSLADNLSLDTVVHELGHAIGLSHEHTRSDRRRWLTTRLENVSKPYVANYFEQRVGSSPAGTPYDLASIEHYGGQDFSYDGKVVFETRPRFIPVGSDLPTEVDLRGVAAAYGAPKSETVVITNPPGLPVEIDGVATQTPAHLNWGAGSRHTLRAPAIQGSGDTRLVFARWSDDAPAVHDVIVPEGGAAYIANFIRQCRVTLRPESPLGSGTFLVSPYSPDGYYACESEITLTARPAPGYRLYTWAFSDVPDLDQVTFVVRAPRSITGQFTNQPVVTVRSSSPGVSWVAVDGRQYAWYPRNFLWRTGSTHTIEGRDYLPCSYSIDYRFDGWEHGGAPKQTVPAPPVGQSAEYVAKFSPRVHLWTQTQGVGEVDRNPASGDKRYAIGAKVQLTARRSDAPFVGWGGDVTGTSPVQTVAVTGQTLAIGHFLAALSPPTVSALVPASAAAGSGPASISVSGKNFYNGLTSVAVDGGPRAARFLSSTEMEFSLSADETALPREYSISLANLSKPASTTLNLRITEPSAACTYSLPEARVRAAATGGAFSLPVITGAGCPWYPVAGAAWLDAVPPPETRGPGYLVLEVFPNPSSKLRTSFIRLAGRTVDVEQEGLPCQVDLQARSFTFPPAGGSASLVARLLVPDCDSTASANAGWVKIAPSTITQGGRVVQFTVEANPGDPRKATLRIAGVEVPVTQATANPFIASVLNGGSLAASPLSPGARFALAGVNLAGATVAAPADRWPVSLGGVRVTLDGVDAPLGLVSPERIVGQVPWGVKVGDVRLTLQVGDAPARAASVTVREAAPGLFSAEAGKTLALNEDGTQNLRVNPAAAGSLITVFLTGQGPVDAAAEDGAGAPADPTVKPMLPLAASIGGQTAEVTSAELAPGQVGVLRLGLRVPEVADGERPLTVTIGGAASNTGAIYVGQPNCVPKPEGLTSFWPADGTPEDVVGGLSATLQNGASYAPGFVGEAFSLDGIDDYVSVPDAPVLNPVAAVSVEAWIYRSGAVGLNDPVVKKAYTASTVRGGYTLEFTGNSIGFWAFTESKGWSRSALGPVPFGAWTHVAGVHDGSALRVYVDGRAAGAAVAAPGPLVPSSNPLNIGRDPINAGRFFRGLIDEVGIYSRALSEAEIQVLYVRGARGKCRN